jgi:type I restriction enzyme R subunit
MKMVMLQPDEETISSLASRLNRIDKQINETDRNKFKEICGKSLTEVTKNLTDIYEPDLFTELAKRKFNLDDETEPTDEQVKQSIEPLIIEVVKPFDDPKLREFIETVRQKIYQVIDTVNIDKVTHSGFNTKAKEEAEEVINNFRKFIDENKNEIAALRIIYSQPHRRKELTLKMITELKEALASPPYALTAEKIWNAYHRLEPQQVTGLNAARILTDIISLIRYELGIDKELKPYSEIVNINFKNWIFRRQAVGKIFTDEQIEWLRMIKDTIATSVRIEKDDFEYTPFAEKGKLGRFFSLFGDESEKLIEEINEVFIIY